MAITSNTDKLYDTDLTDAAWELIAMGIVGAVLIKCRFQVSERVLIFFARLGDNSESIANRIKDCFLWFFQFGGVVSRSAF
jgi:hypothetical protein